MVELKLLLVSASAVAVAVGLLTLYRQNSAPTKIPDDLFSDEPAVQRTAAPQRSQPKVGRKDEDEWETVDDDEEDDLDEEEMMKEFHTALEEELRDTITRLSTEKKEHPRRWSQEKEAELRRVMGEYMELMALGFGDGDEDEDDGEWGDDDMGFDDDGDY